MGVAALPLHPGPGGLGIGKASQPPLPMSRRSDPPPAAAAAPEGPGALNIVKLCVGTERVEDLIAWQAARRDRYPEGTPEHITRMWPKRAAELLDGGSLYWVFRGEILARQRILGLAERRGADGIARCALLLAPEVIRTVPAQRRPFQGWRYLPGSEAPRDLPPARAEDSALPEDLARALADLGLH